MLIAKALLLKLQCRKELLDAYFNTKDFTKTLALADQNIQVLKQLKDSYRTMWMTRYRPFGFDVLQSRFASLVERFEELKLRIKDLENNVITKIDELHEKEELGQYIRYTFEHIFYTSRPF